MKLKVLTLKLNVDSGTFDTAPLDQFQAEGRELVEISEHYFQHDNTPTLVLLIRYRDTDPVRTRDIDAPPRREWRNELDGDARKLYEVLSEWRGRRSKKEGMPAFLILNNRQLAAVAAARPVTLASLRAVEGIGESRSTRWGADILAVVAAAMGRIPCDQQSIVVSETVPGTPSEPVPSAPRSLIGTEVENGR